MMDAMIDLETLSTGLDCVVLTLGGVKFNPYTLEEPYDPIYLKFTLDDQCEQGRIIDEDTLDWWSRQSKSVKDEAFGEEDRISMEEGLDMFHKWAWPSKRIWSNGAVFDVMVMENLYRQFQRTPAWSFWEIRDVRTINDLGNMRMPKEDLHNALADAYHQAKGVQYVITDLGLEEYG